MKKIIISALVFCSLALAQSSSTHGLEIPTTHPRLWWTSERLAQARGWYATNAFTPQSSDYVGHAFRYLMTGDAASARIAINYAMSQTLTDTGGTASNGARWYGEQVILIYDWCWNAMTPAERSTLVTRWNGYLDILRQKSWGGTSMPQNNYFWGYTRNMIEWGIATWGENSQASAFLDEALDKRWENAFVPHSARYGKGGVMQEGSQYGRYLADYVSVPLVTARLHGRDMFEETRFFKEALFYIIYGTTPGRTVLEGSSNSFFELFPSNDDHDFTGGGTAEKGDFGTFMTALADAWRDRPLGQWARQWLTTVRPAVPSFVKAVDRGGVASPFSTLPLDFLAQGPQWLLGRSAWTSQATAFQLQLGLLDGVGHSHQDVGSWQIWRNGRWLSRESTGYSGNSLAGWGGSGSVDTGSSLAHNMIMVNGIGMAAEQNGPPVIKRLESQNTFSYTAVDLTPSYRNNLVQYPRPDRDNAAVAVVEREFLFIRPLETMVIFDRIQSNSSVMAAESVVKGFVAHFEQAPVSDGSNSYVGINGDQALRVTTLVPANAQSRVVAEGGRYGTHRLELSTSGAAQSYFLNVLQGRDASGANLLSQVTETPTAYVVTLQHPTRGSVRIEFGKGATSTGGGMNYSATSMPTSVTPFTTAVQSFEVTDAGPVWGGGVAPPPAQPGDTTPPTISGVNASNIGVTSATINWATNEAADGQIEFGPTTAYGQVLTASTSLATTHSAQLSGLSAGATYHYRVRSRDAAGNLAVSGDYTCTTGTDSQLTISASATPGGSISPAGATTVPVGGTRTFTIAPNSSHRIANVAVNGNSMGPVSSYTFAEVTTNQTIAATFEADDTTEAPAAIGSTTVTMTVHAYAGDGPANLVSNAIPFKPGVLSNARNVRVVDAGVEVPVAAQVLATWPQDGSIRSLLLQFNALFSTTTKNFTVEIGTARTTSDLSLIPITWNLPQRIFTLPATYLSQSLVTWEQVPHGQTGFPAWEQKQIQSYSSIATVGTSPCVRNDNYYDATTTTYQMYVRTGDLRYLVNARRWALHHRRDQIWLDGTNIGHPRCDGAYLNNTRYTFPQALVTDYFMFGDPEARRVSAAVVDNFYMDSDWSWWWYKAPNARGFWTEREPAFALNGVVAQYEATGDARYLTFARDRVASLQRMQVENNRRAWVHNLYDHDPSEGCASGDYGSSPWMSGLLLESVIRYHKLTGDPIARESILMAVDDLRSRYLATSSYANQSFVYLGCSAYRDGAPDLDNLISHAFGYAYRLTGEVSYRQLGTTLFNVAVANGYAGAHKQFNQQFRSSGLFVGYITTPAVQPPTDTTAPTVAVNSPTASQSVSATINATATASDNVAVTGVQFLIDGLSYGAEDTASPYTVAVNTTSLSNGTHTISARARDAAGNTANSSVVSFTVNNTTPDTTAPAVAVTSPTASQLVSGTMTMTATATDAVGVVGVQFLIDGQPYGAEDTASPYSVAVNTTTLTNGTHTILARARDAAGNTANSSVVSFTVNNTTPDTTAPAVAVTSPTASQRVSGTMMMTATATDAVAVAGVQFLIDGQPYGAEDTSAPYSLAMSTASLTNANHTVAARARDAAGNVATSPVVTFTVGNTTPDTTAPAVAITSPTAGQRVSGTMTMTATATDAVGVVGVQFLIDGQPYGAEDTTAPYSLAMSTASLTNANHTVSARARDAAGNVAASGIVTFTVSNSTGTGDTVAPVVAITAPIADALLNSTVTLSATASDNVGVTRVEFFVDDKSVGVDTSAPYSISWNSKTVATYEVSTHTIHAIATDAAGNSTKSATVTFRVRGR